MIYTVTFNPSLDYIVSVDDFTCGIVNRTTDEIIFPGGKGINVSDSFKESWSLRIQRLAFLAGFDRKQNTGTVRGKRKSAPILSAWKMEFPELM